MGALQRGGPAGGRSGCLGEKRCAEVGQASRLACCVGRSGATYVRVRPVQGRRVSFGRRGKV